MAYIYLLDIYKLINQRLAHAQAAVKEGSDNPDEIKFQEGRIKALTDFKAYLTTNFNPKLPRRIREAIQTKTE